jgi:hypothetical protein
MSSNTSDIYENIYENIAEQIKDINSSSTFIKQNKILNLFKFMAETKFMECCCDMSLSFSILKKVIECYFASEKNSSPNEELRKFVMYFINAFDETFFSLVK